MAIYSGFYHQKWGFSWIFHSYVSLPKGNIEKIVSLCLSYSQWNMETCSIVAEMYKTAAVGLRLIVRCANLLVDRFLVAWLNSDVGYVSSIKVYNLRWLTTYPSAIKHCSWKSPLWRLFFENIILLGHVPLPRLTTHVFFLSNRLSNELGELRNSCTIDGKVIQSETCHCNKSDLVLPTSWETSKTESLKGGITDCNICNSVCKCSWPNGLANKYDQQKRKEVFGIRSVVLQCTLVHIKIHTLSKVRCTWIQTMGYSGTNITTPGLRKYTSSEQKHRSVCAKVPWKTTKSD